MKTLLESMTNQSIDLSKPVCLFDNGTHQVHWVGSVEDTLFRCNAYLLQDGTETFLIDPGAGRQHFPQVFKRVAMVTDPRKVNRIIVHHQDPDLCSSIPHWLEINPEIEVMTNSRVGVLIPYYGFDKSRIVEVDDQTHSLQNGGELQFVGTPFLHFPGAFNTFDTVSGFLFTSDICAAISGEWQLFVENIEEHFAAMDLFHIDYMAGNKALRGYVDKVERLPVKALLPQHGSVIREEDIPATLRHLSELRCGLDLIYPDPA